MGKSLVPRPTGGCEGFKALLHRLQRSVEAPCLLRIPSVEFTGRSRTEDHKSNLLSADPVDGVHQRAQVRGEFGNEGGLLGGRQRRRFQCGRHSVAQEGHGRLDQSHLLLDSLEPVGLGLVPIEAGAGTSHRAVGRPGEISEGHIPVRKRGGHPGFEVAIIHLPLKKGVADEEHAVAVLEFERRCSLERGRDQRPNRAQHPDLPVPETSVGKFHEFRSPASTAPPIKPFTGTGPREF